MADVQNTFQPENTKRRVLVVEDEMINQEILREMLCGSAEALVAGTGGEALRILEEEKNRLSLVLLDLNLPDMHGMDVLSRMRGDPETARIPVIVMTADRKAEVESLSLGAIDFIPKPYPQPEVVMARIRRTIELFEDRNLIRSTERDQLTGLYNKEYFYRYAEQYDGGHEDVPTDAIVIDVNHFHMINDRYGRSRGDEVLRHIGAKLLEIAGESGGIVCRREADTFLIYCPHREDYDEILYRAGVSPGGGKSEGRVHLRMGVYADADKSVDIERRFDRAKLAADRVRNNYSRSVGIYDRSLHESEVFAEQLVEEFPAAIAGHQFVVYYQPKFDIRSDEPVISSAEALVRWKHPELGLVSPGLFIPLFEENGLIQELDNYVWREAARQIKEWKDRLGVSLPVSVNVSRVDMYDPGFVESMRDIVRESGIETSELILEVTESAYTGDSDRIIRSVSALRELGFRIEMDDFGSGYSSLNMLSALPVDALKLDMQFVRSAFRERKDTRLLEIVLRISDSLGVPSIAEGVETAEQMITLKSMGCDIVQGYYFSRPLPAEEFDEFVTGRRDVGTDSPKQGKKQSFDQFTYDALHDPLTGLYNHTAFDILFRDSDKDHIAVLIADIVGYEDIKRGGQAAADRVVSRTASVLKGSFRSADDICRLKEDEFVIIMTRMNSGMQDLVLDKIEAVNEILMNPEDGEAPVSLVVGTAFSDRENPEGDIFKDADSALVKMKQTAKESGR